MVPRFKGARIMAQNLTYVLPRAFIVLVGWGATYFILTALSTHLPPAVVYMTGIAWVLAGIVCFGYIYRLRRDAGTLPHQQVAVAEQAGSPPTARERFYAALPPNRQSSL
jgi:hypothetical protein